MACLDANHVLAYLGRELGEGERRAADEHLDRCDECRALLAELARSPLIGELAAADPEAEEPPRVGRYILGQRLGAGGMGVVHAAHDPELDRPVALKLVDPERVAAGGVDRLLREGRTMARLSHPNVVAVHDAGLAGEQVFIAMELVAGANLAAWLRAAPRSWQQITSVFVDAGRGLAAAHAAGVVHRDFKPENVIVGDDGRARVCDFGLAASRAAGAETGAAGDAPDGAAGRLTVTGALVGTPALMSPEQHRGAEIGPASDQFSFCAALYAALCGQRPFAGDSVAELRAQVLAGALRPVPRRAGLPRSLCRALARGLAVDPAARFPSMAALLDAVDPARRARRLRRGAVAASLAAALGLGALAAAARDPEPAALPAACRAAAAARESVWTQPVRARVEQAMLATKLPYAAATWERVDASMRRYLADIAAREEQACSSVPRSEAARASFELAMRCLAERRAEAAALAGELAAVDAAGVRTALTRIQRVLPMASDCDDDAQLRAEARLRETGAGAAAYADIRAALREARALPAAGNYLQAVAAARRAVERARAVGHDVLLARALIQLAEASAPVEGFESAEAAAREAVTAAERSGADELRAIALARLMESIAAQPGREREALALEPLVAAAIERSGLAALEPVRLGSAARAHFGLRQLDEALRGFQAALAAQREALPPGDPRLPAYVHRVAVLLGRVGRSEEALAMHREALTLAEDSYGSRHPELGLYLINLASQEGALGRCGDALDLYERARALLTGVLPADSRELLLVREGMGHCLAAQGRHDEALASYRAQLGALVDAGRERSVEAVDARLGIGDVHLAVGDRRAALAEYRTSLALCEELLGTRDVRLGLPLGRIGELHLAAGRPARAVAPLERALGIYEAAGTDELSRADARFALARALGALGRERARALELGRRALAAYQAAGAAHADRRAAVARWLAARD